MAASGQNLGENKDHSEEVMPYEVWKLPKPIVEMIAEYAIDEPWVNRPFLFSGTDRALQQILFLAKHAGPLDKFKFFVTRLIQQELASEAKENILIDRSFIIANTQGPLMQCLVSLMEQTVRKEDSTEIDPGMAECFMKVVTELLPHRRNDVLAQARRGAPLEDAKVKAKREEINTAQVEQLFDAFIKLDLRKDAKPEEAITAFKRAIETFKEFVANIKRGSMNEAGYMIDNRFLVNLIHLNSVALNVLAREGGQLPPIEEEHSDVFDALRRELCGLPLKDAKDRGKELKQTDDGGWFGKRSDLFCYAILAITLQPADDLSDRLKQLLRNGLYYLFHQNRSAARVMDAAGDLFRGVGVNYLHGVDSYYDDMGRRQWGHEAVSGRFFQKLLRAITSAAEFYATAEPAQTRRPALSSHVD